MDAQVVFNYGLLRFLRDDKNLSRNDLIINLGKIGLEITSVTLANWEEGKTSPDANDLPKLAEVLGCAVEDFYRPTNDR